MRGAGAGDGAGRAGRAVGADRRAGRVQRATGDVGGGEPGREADLDHRGDGCRRGQHRRSGRDPLRRDEAAVRRGVRAGHVGSVPARVHPRPHACSWRRCCGRIWSTWSSTPVCCPGSRQRAFVDIDSLLRPVFGHAKQGARFGHTKIAGKQVLRKGLSPLATTICTEHGAPVVAGIRLRAGRAGSGKGAATMVHRGDQHRPRRRRHRRDPGPRRLRLRQQRGRRRLPQGRGPVLAGADQEPGGDRGDRHHPRATRGPRCTTPARSSTRTPGS